MRCDIKIWRQELSFFLLSLRWVGYVKCLSKIKLKYLTWDLLGMTEWFSKTGVQSPGHREKVVWEDFVLLNFIFYLMSHFCRRFKWFWICLLTMFGITFDTRNAVSYSEYSNQVLQVVGRSETKRMYMKEAMSLPWGCHIKLCIRWKVGNYVELYFTLRYLTNFTPWSVSEMWSD